jgi:hypothetical protein
LPVKYTTGPIKFSNTIRYDTVAHWVADLDGVLSAVATARATVSGGFKYTLQSPDGLQMKLWIQDIAGTATLTPTSADESYTGDVATMATGDSGPNYQAWANKCQFFLARVGQSDNFRTPWNFACGILALPVGSGPCTINGPAPNITELWWDSPANAAINGLDWRSCRYSDGSFTLRYNGVVFTRTDGLLNMLVLAEAYNVDYNYGSPTTLMKYINGLAFHTDSLVSIGQIIYGQMWDSFINSIPLAIDSTQTLNDVDDNGNTFSTTWLTWNYAPPNTPDSTGAVTVLGCLQLLLTPVSSNILQNYSY